MILATGGLLAAYLIVVFAIYLTLCFISAIIRTIKRGAVQAQKRRDQALLIKKEKIAENSAKKILLEKTASFETQIESLKKELAASNNAKEAAYKKLAHDHEELKGTHEKMKENIKGLDRLLQGQKDQASQLKSENERLLKAVESQQNIQKELNASTQENKTLKQQLAGLEHKNQEWRVTSQNTEEEKLKHNKLEEETKKELTKYRELHNLELVKNEEIMKKADAQIEEARKKQEELEEELTKSINTEFALRNDLKELEEERKEASQKTKELVALKVALEHQGRNLQSGMEQKQNKIQSLEKELESVKQELDTLRRKALNQPAAPIQPASKDTEASAPVQSGSALTTNNYSIQAWLRRFSFSQYEERIWITRSEFELVEEELKEKNALIEKYCPGFHPAKQEIS